MFNPDMLAGQWIGYYSYGPEYGEIVNGEKVEFRLFINTFQNGEFIGKSIDLDGITINQEVGKVRGFINDNFISFTKQFPYYEGIDEDGNSYEDRSKVPTPILYTGYYDERSKAFTGNWEIREDIMPVGEGWLENIATGTWEIRKDE